MPRVTGGAALACPGRRRRSMYRCAWVKVGLYRYLMKFERGSGFGSGAADCWGVSVSLATARPCCCCGCCCCCCALHCTTCCSVQLVCVVDSVCLVRVLVVALLGRCLVEHAHGCATARRLRHATQLYMHDINVSGPSEEHRHARR